MKTFELSDLCLAINSAQVRMARVPFLVMAQNAATGTGTTEILENKREVTAALLDDILPKIKNQVTVCGQVADKYSEWVADSADYRAGFLKSIKVMDEKEAALIANINALEASLESLDNDRRACKAELDQKIRERNAKEKELKKYCWVPFYNIYLLVEYEEAVDSCERKYKEYDRQIQEIQRQLDETVHQKADAELKDNNLKGLIQLFDSQSLELNKRLNDAKDMVYEWNQAYTYFVRLKSDLETLDDFEELLDDAYRHLEEAEKNEAAIDYSVLEMGDIYMGNYHIRNFDGSCFGMNRDNRMIVSCNGSDAGTVFSLATLTNGSTLLLNNDYLVAAYGAKEQIHFESICRAGGYVVDRESFYITPYSDNAGQVRFGASKDAHALCMDISKGKYCDGTQILMWPGHTHDNQRFILEKIR